MHGLTNLLGAHSNLQPQDIVLIAPDFPDAAVIEGLPGLPPVAITAIEGRCSWAEQHREGKSIAQLRANDWPGKVDRDSERTEQCAVRD